MKMSGHTVLITGGTSGIGKALAAQLLKRGNTVLITGRSEDRLAEARQAMPGVHTYVCDQSDPSAIERLCAEATRTGGIDLPAFYARRVRRLLPASTLMLLATLGGALLLLGTAAGISIAEMSKLGH